MNREKYGQTKESVWVSFFRRPTHGQGRDHSTTLGQQKMGNDWCDCLVPATFFLSFFYVCCNGLSFTQHFSLSFVIRLPLFFVPLYFFSPQKSFFNMLFFSVSFVFFYPNSIKKSFPPECHLNIFYYWKNNETNRKKYLFVKKRDKKNYENTLETFEHVFIFIYQKKLLSLIIFFYHIFASLFFSGKKKDKKKSKK